MEIFDEMIKNLAINRNKRSLKQDAMESPFANKRYSNEAPSK